LLGRSAAAEAGAGIEAHVLGSTFNIAASTAASTPYILYIQFIGGWNGLQSDDLLLSGVLCLIKQLLLFGAAEEAGAEFEAAAAGGGVGRGFRLIEEIGLGILVVSDHQGARLDGAERLQGYRDQDQHAGAADGDIDGGETLGNDRHDSQHA